ncbi:MAG: PD-(D/E)XK nuclease-like domain-containing protein [Rhizobiales bacterium]|nr:PD-(D/E)XK nuclease-like domain-containing protein [Hyphomicrobiales bacterium]
MLTHKRADTPALAFSRAIHAMVFEPELFNSEIAIWGGERRQGKAWTDFKDANIGKTIFSSAEIDEAMAIARAVRAHPLVVPYMQDTGAEYECSLIWTDVNSGLQCKARPDWIVPSTRTLIDLKTTISIDGRRFGASVARYMYHCQMAHYAAGIHSGSGWMPQSILLVAVEKSAPYDVGVFEIDADSLWYATDEVGKLLVRVAECRASGRWPGRYTEPQALQLPAWVGMDDDDDGPDAFGIELGE